MLYNLSPTVLSAAEAANLRVEFSVPATSNVEVNV